MKHLVGVTRNGVQVYTQLTNSLAGQRIARQPQLLTLAHEMLAAVPVRGHEVIMEYDMQRPIGYSFIVETTDTDVVFYGRLLKDEVYMRFVKNTKPVPTRHLTVTLLRDNDGNYELSDLWIGHAMPPRPGSVNETTESRPYWLAHAFILGDQVLQTQTVTKTCPY